MVNLLELGAAAIAGTVSATHPIREYSERRTKQKNARTKLDGSVVTDADFAAQRCIIRALKSVSDRVVIVGEESLEEMEQHHALHHNNDDSSTTFENPTSEGLIYEYARHELFHRFYGLAMDHPPLSEQQQQSPPETTTTTFDMTSKELENDNNNNMNNLNNNLPQVEVEDSRVTVLVDPLDGTKCYAQGEYDSVTILTAIIVDNIPVFGVITKPFRYKNYPCLRDTGCFTIYGGTLLRGVFRAGATSAFVRKQTSNKPRAMISKSRSKGIVKSFFDLLCQQDVIHPEPMHVSGAGEKALRLVIGSEDESAWLFPKEGTSRWDVAALDALLRQTGGKLTNKYGEELDYSKSREDAENLEGIIACSDKELHAKCMETLRRGLQEEGSLGMVD